MLREKGTMKAAVVANIDKKDEIVKKIQEYKIENKIDEVTSKQIKEYVPYNKLVTYIK